MIAYRSLASWRGDGAFGAWLARIAIRLAIRKASQRRAVTWHRPDGGPDGTALDPIDVAMDQASLDARPQTDPSALMLRAEHATDIRTAVAALPEPYREVVTLRFFGELSLDEIALETQRPLGTVKTHLHRGLLRLRATMTERAER